MIVGIGGYARSGKDSAAAGLAEIGFKRVAFADKLREFIYALNPLLGVAYAGVHIRLQDVIDEAGWDGYKETLWSNEIRQLLQRLGTECGRELISDTIWIDAALDGVVGDICVTDMRFPNEMQAVKHRGGIAVRINRPGVGPANSHPSETALDDADFDYVIENSGTVEDLHLKIREVVATHNVREIARAAKHGFRFNGGKV